MKIIDEMVSRFLSWRLPQDFSPDCGIKFTVINHPHALTHLWPVGTNLLNADQAQKMLEHVAGPALAAKQAEIDRLMLEFCPDEMTEEQMANWASHQRAATPEETAVIEAAIGKRE